MIRRVLLVVLAILIVSAPAFSQVRDYAYIAVPDQNAVSVFDNETLTFVTSIPVGTRPQSVVFGPDRTRAYALNSLSFDISVINTITERVEETIALEGSPANMAVEPDRPLAFVTVNTGVEHDQDLVAVIDVDPGSPTFNTILGATPANKGLDSVAFTPDGGKVYVSSAFAHSVSVLTTIVMPPVVIGVIDFGFGQPASIAVSPTHFFAYIAECLCDQDPFNVTWILDTRFDEIVGAVDLWPATGGIVFAADGRHAYAVTSSVDQFIDAAVWEIDTETQTVTRRAGSGIMDSYGAGVALTPDGSRVYGTGGAINFLSNVWIVDTTSFDVLASRDLDELPGAVAIATIQRPVSPRVAYVTNNAAGSVSVINTDSLQVVDTIPMPGGPEGVALTLDGQRAYVANQPAVLAIDTATNQVIDQIDVGGIAATVAVTPDGRFAFVTARVGAMISVIETANNTVSDRIQVGSATYGIAITPDGTLAYVTADNAILVIDAIQKTVTDTIPISGIPTAIAITPDGKSAYIPIGSQVLVLDTDAGSPTFKSIVATIDMGSGRGSGVAISPEGTFAYVVDESLGTVLKIRTRTWQIEARISVGSNRPQGIGITRGGGYIFVTNYDAGSVSVIERGTDLVASMIQVERGPWGVAAR